MRKGLIAFLTILFFCNFGRVEYSALNPKAKTIQTDSTAKILASSNPSNLIKSGERDPEPEKADSSEESFSWAKYVVLGIKTFVAGLLKILVA